MLLWLKCVLWLPLRQEKVSKLYDQLITLNMEASEKLCRKLLLDLYVPLAARIQQGTYAKAGGYEIYCRDRDAMVAKYRQHDKKGMKVSVCVCVFTAVIRDW